MLALVALAAERDDVLGDVELAAAADALREDVRGLGGAGLAAPEAGLGSHVGQQVRVEDLHRVNSPKLHRASTSGSRPCAG